MEAAVQLDQERRKSIHLAGIIEYALDLAQHCGWRYAIAYLISEKVPSPVIQRLLDGGLQVRRPSLMRHEDGPSWTGSNADDMSSLFAWLRKRRSVESCERNEVPRASRSSASSQEFN